MPFDPLIFDGHVFGAHGPTSFDCVFDRAIFDGAVFDTCEDVVIVIDTHDGGKDRNRKRIEARANLREQIRYALEGPRAAEIRELVGSGPVVTVDAAKLTEADYRAIADAYQAFLDDEDDIEMLLLS